MLSEELIERIDGVPIGAVVEHFGQLTLRGGKACCPFHRERTPSFHVRGSTNTWHCFGCGRGGGGVHFLMQQGRTWLESMEAIAEFGGIDLPPHGPQSAQAEARERRRAELYAAVAVAEALCIGALRDPQGPRAESALEYCVGRFGDPRVEGTPAHAFGLGYWPDDMDLRLSQSGLADGILQEAGLLHADANPRGGALSGRLVFPIRDASGRAVGFAGRYLGKGKAPKYINTRTSAIYQRAALLYGLDRARGEAHRSERLLLVEGYADALRLHSLGACNAVGVMGTELSDAQADAIARLKCGVGLIGDADAAGRSATLAWGWALLARGVHVDVAQLGDGPDGEKADPYSAIRSVEDLRALAWEPFAVHAAREQWAPLPESDTLRRADFARRLRGALGRFDDTYIDLTARALDALDGGNYWREALRPKRGAGDEVAPVAVGNDAGFLARYHFTVQDGQMHARARGGKKLERISNFTVQPLYYIRGADGESHVRLLRLVNTDGQERILRLDGASDGLFSAKRFRALVGGEGNFIYHGGEEAFAGLLEYCFGHSKDCVGLGRLGWDGEHGFWVWANGIYSGGAFHPFGPSGVARVGNRHYHFDAARCGGAGASRFVHREGAHRVGLSEWLGWMHRVYGGPGVVAALYVVATINRDAVSTFGPLPILNATGPRGTGKSMLANSIMRLFFTDFTIPNLPSSTLASLSATLSTYSHVPVGLDEYSNSIGTAKVELLKSLYDGGGRLKMGEHGRAVVSEVRCGVFMCGQHVAESDVALFSRLIYMDFQRTRYSREDEETLRELQGLEREGLTHLVHALVELRGEFAARFPRAYQEAKPQMDAVLRAHASEGVISRTVHIWTVLLATFIASEELIGWPFRASDVVRILQELLSAQRSEMVGSDDVNNFWSVFLYLTSTGVLREDIDYRIEERGFVVTDNQSTRLTFDRPQRVLLVDMSTAIGRYVEHGARMHGDNLLSPLTLRNYLRKSQGFLTSYHKSRLCINDGRGGVVMEHYGGVLRPKRKIKCCYAFGVDQLPFDLQHLSAEIDGLSPPIVDGETSLKPIEGYEGAYPFRYDD